MTTPDICFLVSSLICGFTLVISYWAYKKKDVQRTIDELLIQFYSYLAFSILVLFPYCVGVLIEDSDGIIDNAVSLAFIIACNLVAIPSKKILPKNRIAEEYKLYIHAFILTLSIIFLINQAWVMSVNSFLHFLGLYIGFNFDSDCNQIKKKLHKFRKKELGILSKKSIVLLISYYLLSPLIQIIEENKCAVFFPWIVVLVLLVVIAVILRLVTKHQVITLQGTIKALYDRTNTATPMHKGNLKMRANINGKNHLVVIFLSTQNRSIACDAYRDGKEIQVSGTLTRQFNRYFFSKVTILKSI